LSKITVVLFNLGGPDSLEAVQPFLENLFSDPDIFKLPFRKIFARFISKRSTSKVQKKYELIGGKSPIGYWTELQRKMLEEKLNGKNINADVFTAMRYWHPFIHDVVKKVEQGNYDKIILLPLYPHFSISTTGSSFNEWKRHYKSDPSKVIYINSFYKNVKYLEAVNEKIDESLLKFPVGIRQNVQLVFSAHGIPKNFIIKGDPYLCEIKNCVHELMKLRNNSNEHCLCFQSKVGFMKWLEPSTNNMIKELASKDKKHLLIIPISFVSDHVETLHELNIQYRHTAEKSGVVNYIVMNGLNDSPLFIDVLKDLVKENL
jgi:ferrochelatase